MLIELTARQCWSLFICSPPFSEGRMEDDFTVETTGDGIEPQTQADQDPTPVVEASAEQAEPEQASAEPDPAETPAELEARERDEAGRFAKKEKPRDHPQARVEQAISRQREAERRAADLEARLAAVEAAKAAPERPATPQPAGFPDYLGWAAQAGNGERSYEDYLDDRADYRSTIREQARERQQRGQAFQTRANQALSERPELRSAIEATSHIQLTPAIEQAIVASEQGIDIAEYLALHPEDFAQLAADSRNDVSPDAAKWMRRYLESKVAGAASPTTVSAPRPAISAAKTPLKTVGSSPTPADPLAISDDLDVDEHIKRMNAIERQAQRRGL